MHQELSTEADTKAYERVRLVLAGHLVPDLNLTDAKMVHLATGSACDIKIARSAPVEMQFLSRPKRRPHTYFARVGPGLVYRLMRGLELGAVNEATVGVLQSRSLAGPFTQSSLAVWMIPTDRQLTIRLRQCPNAHPPASTAVPMQGPWSLPPQVPEAVAPERTWVTGERSCPACNQQPERFRVVHGAWICEACGRSFEP